MLAPNERNPRPEVRQTGALQGNPAGATRFKWLFARLAVAA